jgi:shikimate dehydrogenase
MKISGKTALFGVIGDPIGHTLSPAIQNAAFKALKMDCIFIAFKVMSNGVENAMLGVRGLGIRGLNVTMPQKNAVIPFLDEIDETALILGSVNTILNEEGRLRGFSTDGTGAHQALEANGVDLAGKKLVLLGAGGAAKAIAFSLVKEVNELVILSRTPSKMDAIAQVITQKFNKKIAASLLSNTALQESLRDADILINATSVGMNPHPSESLVKPNWIKPGLAVMDIVYSPLETKLAKDAKAVGAKIVNGLDMLVFQGAASFEIWTGKSAPAEVMKHAALNQLERGT